MRTKDIFPCPFALHLERGLRTEPELGSRQLLLQHRPVAMPNLSGLQIAFLAFNAAVGLAVGLLTALSPGFAGLGLPVFAWLILAMFAFEVVAGLVLKVHPATAITMLMRVGAITISVLVCLATVGFFQPA